jgi:hypothetical protein
VIGPLAVLAALLAIVIWGSFARIGVGQATIVFASVVALIMVEATGDLTRWSMHPFYKRRLASAFALERYPSPDGVRAEAVDYDTIVKLSELDQIDRRVFGPELVVCAAANLSDPGAEPPGRPVSTFTFSDTHVGGGWLGLLTPEALEDAADGQYRRDVSLSAAVAISGAAISPAMGKIGKRRYSFLLGLANARLGVWLPNPLFVGRNQRRASDRLEDRGREGVVTQQMLATELPRVWGRSGVARPHYLIKEMLGRTSYRDRFVYVTDGGHFENLGLVELLRRGCSFVYCFDASGGDVDSFATLGQAIAIARSELGVEISIDPKPLADDVSTSPTDLPDGIHVGRIRYSNSDQPDGRIVFARAIVTDDAPWDVRAYKERDPKFPTHGLLDQLYTDEKFEAYRALGHFMATRSVAAMHGAYD